MPTAGPNPQAIILSILAGLGVIGDNNNAPVSYNPLTLTASYCQTVPVPVPAGAVEQEIDLTTLFPASTAPLLVVVQEVSVQTAVSPAVPTPWTGVLQWGWDSGSKAQFLPGDIWLTKLDPSAALPNLFINNTDVANGAILQITVIGS
jgi:hypothetical protein